MNSKGRKVELDRGSSVNGVVDFKGLAADYAASELEKYRVLHPSPRAWSYLVARYVWSMKIVDIARSAGRSSSTVSQTLTRLRRQLERVEQAERRRRRCEALEMELEMHRLER